ncbi:MAG: Hsp20/alpha crystallin family protein [Bacteroidia bacterium]|nr:Hsp20/alpha crystallin family protein [Bacteroidia bacterium]
MRHNRHKYNTGFEPFTSLIDDLFKTSIGDIVGGDISFNTPSANTKETDKAFIIELAVPGIQKDDFNIEIDKDHLVVSVDIDKKTSVAEEDDYKRREFDYRKFRRSFRLNDSIDRNHIKATYDLGVLNLNLPKLGAEILEKKTTINVD